MMTGMSITLTCTCGQQQFVAESLAGQSIGCVLCGKALAVPAMGLLSSGNKCAKPQASASANVGWMLLAAGALLLLIAGGGGLAWKLSQRQPAEPVVIAVNRPVETPIERPRPAPVKNESASIQPPPPKVEPPPVVVEPVKPKIAPPPKIVMPLPKPKDSPPPIVEKKPINVAEPVKLVWKLTEGDTFYQELIVAQKPTFKVGGLPVASLLSYRIVSRFTVKKREGSGALVVEQKIETAKLLLADDLSKSTVEGAIANLPGTTYTLHLSPTMDVTKFDGAAGGLNVANLGLGFQAASLINRDGWKELAQATFFQLDQAPRANLRWSKPMSHNWGGLGAWHGQIHYAYLGQEAKLHKVAYGLQLAYKSPAAGAVGLMTVNSANFKAPEAGGFLLFDASQGRVVAAEERFRVRGLINANVLGQNTLIEIDEDQHFLMRIHDNRP